MNSVSTITSDHLQVTEILRVTAFANTYSNHLKRFGAMTRRVHYGNGVFEDFDPLLYEATIAAGRRHADRVSHILRSAVESVQEDTFSLADVASRAGTTVPSIYRYFASGQSLRSVASIVAIESNFLQRNKWISERPSDDSTANSDRLSDWSEAVTAGEKSVAQRVRWLSNAIQQEDGTDLSVSLHRTCSRISNHLRLWQASSSITDDVEPFVQSAFMLSLDVSSWTTICQAPDSAHAPPIPLDALIQSLRILGPRNVLATGTWQRNRRRQSSIQKPHQSIDSEIDRILRIEVDEPTPSHTAVIRIAISEIARSLRADFTIEHVLSESGILPKSLYELFESKEQIRRIALWTLSSFSMCEQFGVLGRISDSKDPELYLSDYLQHFADASGRKQRAVRLHGLAGVISHSKLPDFSLFIRNELENAKHSLEELQTSGRLSDRISAESATLLLASMAVSHVMVDGLGESVPDAAWGWQLDSTFGELLGVSGLTDNQTRIY